jgi:hypothetical protein
LGVRPTLPVDKGDVQPVFDAGDLLRAGAQDQLDSAPRELLDQQLGQFAVHALQQPIGQADQRRRDAERGEDRGELDADRSAADDDDVVGGRRDRVDLVGVINVGIVERDAGGVRRAGSGGQQDRPCGYLALDAVRGGDVDGAVDAESGDPLQVFDATGGEPVGDGVLKHVTHVFDAGAQGRQHHVQRHGCPHAIDLLLAVAGQIQRGLAQRLRGSPASGSDHSTGSIALHDEHSAPEGRRELGRDVPGRTGAEHHQVVDLVHD